MEKSKKNRESIEGAQPLAGRSVLLGVCGSIAAYKAADVCSRLSKLGADVHVVLTANGAQFVGAATFRALTRNPVVSDVFDEPVARRIAHIDLAQSADLVLVAPASADMLAHMAHGLADDMLTTCLLATPPATPLLVAPAMNTVMWEHPATVANVHILAARGVQMIYPALGLLVCQDVGTGKLADVDAIIDAVIARLTTPETTLDHVHGPQLAAQSVSSGNSSSGNTEKDAAGNANWTGLRVLITAGATREPLDPVRFLSNRSSGKMGYAIAHEAARRGASVTLVSGFATATLPDAGQPPDPKFKIQNPKSPGCVELVRVQTAEEMLAACQAHFTDADIFIAAAAVADYAPETVQPHKIKKPVLSAGQDGENDSNDAEEIITLRLKRTPDILAALARQKRPDQIMVGFAAETQDLLANAQAKLKSKRLDMIVANDVTAEGAGFETDTNIVTLLWPNGRMEALPKASKFDIAARILDYIPFRSGGFD
jgi:phosphopantothenoylcysteine decarboxylase/phosphopantothenate--cysteine ligase